MPNVIAKRFRLRATDWQVTDADIAAGETLGALFDADIKRGSHTIFYSYRDEHATTVLLCDALSPFGGFGREAGSTGLYSDPQPTTATDEDSWWQWNGPFDFRRKWGKNAVLTLEVIAFTNEFGAASAGYVTFELDYQVLEPTNSNVKKCYRLDREYFATSTKHELTGGDLDVVNDIYWLAGTADYASKLKITANGKTIIETDQPQKYGAEYDAVTRQSAQATVTKYLVTGVEIGDKGGRKIQLTNSTTTTATVYYKGK
jgi:hypothetical protein